MHEGLRANLAYCRRIGKRLVILLPPSHYGTIRCRYRSGFVAWLYFIQSSLMVGRTEVHAELESVFGVASVDILGETADTTASPAILG